MVFLLLMTVVIVVQFYWGVLGSYDSSLFRESLDFNVSQYQGTSIVILQQRVAKCKR